MPPQKNTRRTTRKRVSISTKVSSKVSIKRLCTAVTLLVFIVVAIGVISYILIPRSRPTISTAPHTPVKPEPKSFAIAPPFEIFPKEAPHEIPSAPMAPTTSPKKPPVRPEVPIDKRPKVAIIIDDMGYDRKMSRAFLQLDATLTYAILPFSPLRVEIQETADSKGLDTMLHLPMEPLEYPTVNPGEGALFTAMSPDTLIAQLRKDLQAVPGVKGVNNHMGSKMTEVSEQMNQIFSVLKKEGLYFIDSRTTPASLCRSSANLFRIPFAERNVFLDHVQKADIIRNQIELLIREATEKGEAIGIGHPHEVTFEVLEQMLPEIKRKVKLISASEVVHLQN